MTAEGGSRMTPNAHWAEPRGALAKGTLNEKHVWRRWVSFEGYWGAVDFGQEKHCPQFLFRERGRITGVADKNQKVMQSWKIEGMPTFQGKAEQEGTIKDDEHVVEHKHLCVSTTLLYHFSSTLRPCFKKKPVFSPSFLSSSPFQSSKDSKRQAKLCKKR